MTKTMIITGGSRGLGRALSKQAVKAGYGVALIARDQGALESVEEDLRQTISDAMISTHACDLVDQQQVQKAFSEIQEIHKNIVCLINNAGTWTGGKGVVELTREDLSESLDLNFFSAFNCISEFLEIWKEARREVCIVNIGATASLRGGKNTSAFAIAKSSLRILTQSIARELGPEGVHAVHLVLDGLIDNERTRKLNPGTSDDGYMDPEDISKTILEVCSQRRSAWTLELDLRPFNEKF